jgi:hypothetical protein
MHERQAQAQESQQQAEVEALAMPLHAPNVGRVGLGNRATVEMHRQQEEQEGKK